jgi:hypothetical protein
VKGINELIHQKSLYLVLIAILTRMGRGLFGFRRSVIATGILMELLALTDNY